MLRETKANLRSTVTVTDTRPLLALEAGGRRRDVAAPEAPGRTEMNAVCASHETRRRLQRAFN